MSFAPRLQSLCRAHWLRIAAATWLLLISSVALVNSVALSSLAEQAQRADRDAQVNALATRIGQIEQQLAANQHQPAPVSQADFETAHQALQDRLAQLEQAQSESSSAADLQTLQERVERIEAEVEQARQALAAANKPQATKPQPAEPPFRIVGIELRGGEHFLSLIPAGTQTLDQLRLLRPGEAVGAWTLEIIDGHTAVFRTNSQTRRLSVPEHSP